MADVFATAEFEVKHDKLDMYSIMVKMPAPNGPIVFAVSKEQLEKLRDQIKTALGT